MKIRETIRGLFIVCWAFEDRHQSTKWVDNETALHIRLFVFDKQYIKHAVKPLKAQLNKHIFYILCHPVIFDCGKLSKVSDGDNFTEALHTAKKWWGGVQEITTNLLKSPEIKKCFRVTTKVKSKS